MQASAPSASPAQAPRPYAFIGSPRAPPASTASPAVARLLAAPVSSSLVTGSRVSPTAVTISQHRDDESSLSTSGDSNAGSTATDADAVAMDAKLSLSALDTRLAELRRSDAVAFALAEACAEREALLRHVRLAVEDPERLSAEKARLAGVLTELVASAPDVLRDASEARLLQERLEGLATLLHEPTALAEKLERARAQVEELEARHPDLVGLVRAVQEQHRLLETCYLHLNDPARLDAQLACVAAELSILQRERPQVYRRCLELQRSRTFLAAADPTAGSTGAGVTGAATAELESAVEHLTRGPEGCEALRERQRALTRRLLALKARHPEAAALLDRRNRLQAEILALNEAIDDPDAVRARLDELEATRDALRRQHPERVELAARLRRSASPMPGDVITDVRQYTVGDETLRSVSSEHERERERERLRLSSGSGGSPQRGRQELGRLFSTEVQQAVRALVSPPGQRRRH
ncbi:hypothetical protein GMRT_10560 [Giardia muris]|uniref:Uncharacterized protein n=1 Tax=Giardia muris TaxID=5742 RepID=A0A4Z1T375_GIAMU|nr:hypothetical protein GMRT_10560 [Giardia muris]|eukprot:TNJ26861.1 hypothetical protein GMRT_10560 [Giardia muris]